MKPRKVMLRGEVRWLVESYRGKQRRRWFFRSKVAAEGKAAQLVKDREGFGRVWLELEPRERAEVCAVLSEMRKSGVEARIVWEAFRAGKLETVKGSVTVPVALAAMLTGKRTENLRANYLADLKRAVNQFARGREAMLVKDFTVDDVRAFVAAAESPGTRATRRGRMMAFFSFCNDAGWLARNPVDGVKKPKVDRKPPHVLTVDECRAVLALAEAEQPHALGWFALAMFAGIRPEEADKVAWAAVDFDAGVVRLAAATHKTRKAHTVEVPANCFAWLIRARELGAWQPISQSSRKRAVRAVRDKLGWKAWPQDVLRHSFCSYGVAAHGQEWTAQLANHSEKVLRSNYKAVVSKAAALEFFGIEPEANHDERRLGHNLEPTAEKQTTAAP